MNEKPSCEVPEHESLGVGGLFMDLWSRNDRISPSWSQLPDNITVALYNFRLKNMHGVGCARRYELCYGFTAITPRVEAMSSTLAPPFKDSGQ
jgi:hypothetical protein